MAASSPLLILLLPWMLQRKSWAWLPLAHSGHVTAEQSLGRRGDNLLIGQSWEHMPISRAQGGESNPILVDWESGRGAFPKEKLRSSVKRRTRNIRWSKPKSLCFYRPPYLTIFDSEWHWAIFKHQISFLRKKGYHPIKTSMSCVQMRLCPRQSPPSFQCRILTLLGIQLEDMSSLPTWLPLKLSLKRRTFTRVLEKPALSLPR